MKCKDVMKAPVQSCNEKDSATHCAQLMRNHNVGIIPVMNEDGKLSGVVTDRDIALQIVAAGRASSTTVSSIMCKDLLTCAPQDSLKDAEDKMARAKRSRILVTDSIGACVGVISLSDIARVESKRRAGYVLSAVVEREARP